MTAEIIKDAVVAGHNVLLLGQPGTGKTFLVRELKIVLEKLNKTKARSIPLNVCCKLHVLYATKNVNAKKFISYGTSSANFIYM